MTTRLLTARILCATVALALLPSLARAQAAPPLGPHAQPDHSAGIHPPAVARAVHLDARRAAHRLGRGTAALLPRRLQPHHRAEGRDALSRGPALGQNLSQRQAGRSLRLRPDRARPGLPRLRHAARGWSARGAQRPRSGGGAWQGRAQGHHRGQHHPGCQRQGRRRQDSARRAVGADGVARAAALRHRMEVHARSRRRLAVSRLRRLRVARGRVARPH